MATMNVNQSAAFAGLGTASAVVPTAQMVRVEVKSTIPQGSAFKIEVKLNSTSKLISGGDVTDPTPTQQSLGGVVYIPCAALDVINVIFTSTAAVDAVPNACKSVIALTTEL